MPPEMPKPACEGRPGRDSFPGTWRSTDSTTDWRLQLVRNKFHVSSIVAPLVVALVYGEVAS